MALVDKIEELGAAVDAGLIDPGAAAQQLQQYSDGGLTYWGAQDMLSRWQTARGAYADIRMAAELGLAAVEAEQRRDNEEG